MPDSIDPSRGGQLLFQSEYVLIYKRDHWQWVRRPQTNQAVVIIPITDEGQVILVEQYRYPMDSRVIELPAGLAGDIAGEEGETITDAARRELLEETGYHASNMVQLAQGPMTPGLVDMNVSLFLARGLKKVQVGGGDEMEDIVVHTVPLNDLTLWLNKKRASGVMTDIKVYLALNAENMSNRSQVP